MRSADFKYRVRVDVNKVAAPNDSENKYVMAIYNLASGDRGGDEPIELQHSNSGYVWIDGGFGVAHNTDVMHPFTIRNSNKDVIFTITLNPIVDEL